VVTKTAIVVVSLVGFVGSLYLYAVASGDAHDAFSLDDDRIWEAARVGCVGVTQALTEPGSDRQTRITSGNVAIEQLIVGVNALGHDRLAADEPSVDWLDDWERLAVARTAFGKSLVDGKTVSSLEIPEVDGHPITERMISVAPDECNEAITTAAHP